MKTWRDFVVEPIRELLIQHMDETLRSESHWFERLMDEMSEEVSVRVPCRSCGVPFLLTALDHTCTPEDIWLNAYVHSPRTSSIRRDFTRHQTRLQAKYALSPDLPFVFRGLNFATMESGNQFMASIEHGVYKTDTLTSWTTEWSVAARFARFMMPGGHEETLRRSEIRRMLTDQANMTGSVGVVLVAEPQSEDVLCDVSGRTVGGFRESEVILLPGRYAVMIAKQFVRQPGTVPWDPVAEDLRQVGILENL